ncbi:MAG TPA: hypothetical protein VLW85_01400 [Myxococcales bacterium]|nr:hypothetical protein [Myxococcales bacterium]
MILLLLALAAAADPTHKAHEVATALPFAHNAYLELRRAAAAITDPALRAAVEVQLTVVVAADGKHGDFLAAPGGPCEDGHHGYPGGLSVHSLALLQHARGLAATYRHVYGIDVQDDWLVAAAIWHDSLKSVTLPWREDGSCGPESNIAGTPAHHVLGVASAINRHLPGELVYVIAAAHGVDRACEWMQAASMMVRGEKGSCPQKPPVEAFIVHFADSDYALTGLAWKRYVEKAPKGWERYDALKADGNDVLLFSRSW